MTYMVIFEFGPTSVGAYVPDLPGCVAVGPDFAEVWSGIHMAIAMHLEGITEDERAGDNQTGEDA